MRKAFFVVVALVFAQVGLLAAYMFWPSTEPVSAPGPAVAGADARPAVAITPTTGDSTALAESALPPQHETAAPTAESADILAELLIPVDASAGMDLAKLPASESLDSEPILIYVGADSTQGTSSQRPASSNLADTTPFTAGSTGTGFTGAGGSSGGGPASFAGSGAGGAPSGGKSSVTGVQGDTAPAQPEVIWCCVISRDHPNSVQTALKSGLITNVILAAGNRETSDALNEHRDAVRDIVAMTKQAKAKVTLVRFLWPTQPDVARLYRLFDVNHYVREITLLREEAQEIQADFVGLDLEPYNSATEIRQWFRKEREAPDPDVERLNAVVAAAIWFTGQVDYVYPGGNPSPYSPYNTLARLGEKWIAQSTYYDTTWTRQVKHRYEIFGAYLNTTPVNERHLGSHFFTAETIFEKSELWSDKLGVFLYPKEDKAQEVAEALLAYRRQLPTRE